MCRHKTLLICLGGGCVHKGYPNSGLTYGYVNTYVDSYDVIT